MPDSVAYIMNPSIIRTLTYPELEAYLEPCQMFMIVRVIQNSL